MTPYETYEKKAQRMIDTVDAAINAVVSIASETDDPLTNHEAVHLIGDILQMRCEQYRQKENHGHEQN